MIEAAARRKNMLQIGSGDFVSLASFFSLLLKAPGRREPEAYSTTWRTIEFVAAIGDNPTCQNHLGKRPRYEENSCLPDNSSFRTAE